MTEDLSAPLEPTELEELETWLMSDESPEDCMDISMLDGYLAAIVSGPVVLPSEWLKCVWGSKVGPRFKSAAAGQRIVGLITRLQNEVAISLSSDPRHFEPIYYENQLVDPPVEIADEWCYGYMRGVELRRSEWSWLLEGSKYRKLFAPLLSMAYFEGKYEAAYERVHKDKLIFERTKSQIVPSIAALYKLWRERREKKGIKGLKASAAKQFG